MKQKLIQKITNSYTFKFYTSILKPSQTALAKAVKDLDGMQGSIDYMIDKIQL